MYTIFRGEETLQHIDISVVGDTLEANLILVSYLAPDKPVQCVTISGEMS